MRNTRLLNNKVWLASTVENKEIPSLRRGSDPSQNIKCFFSRVMDITFPYLIVRSCATLKSTAASQLSSENVHAAFSYSVYFAGYNQCAVGK